jgi:hypothetical protein
MTPLEERIRAAIREKADQVPADAVPPLLLPERRLFSLTYGGGQRTGALAWRARSLWWLAPAASAVLVAATIAGSVALSHTLLGRRSTGPTGRGAAAASLPAASREAAAWVAAQVSRSVVVSCDPVMCQALSTSGMPGTDLEILRAGGNPQGSGVIVATPAVRLELGARLSSVYAPTIIASFGSGSARTEVRVIAPDGAAAYLRALTEDLVTRKSDGRQLLQSPRLRISAAARLQLRAGLVDTRLMIAIVSMSDQFRFPVSVLAFGDSGPGAAGANSPLRFAELAGPPGADLTRSSFDVQQMLGFMQAQGKTQYAAAWAQEGRLADGRPVLRVQFAAPSPLGLLADNGA